MFIKTLAFSALALAASCATSHAVVAIDNLSKNGAAYASTGNSVGQSFTTGTTAVSLIDIVFPQMGGSSAGGYTNGFVSTETLSLFANGAGNVPTGSALAVFSVANNNLANIGSGAGFSQTTADASTSPISLATNSRYWLVLSSGGATTTYWSAALGGATYGETDALGLALAQDSHTAYQTTGATTTYYAYGAGPQLILIDAVPEPSTYCLMAVAGLALVVSRKRKLA